jgi:hypothetical protein
MTPEVSNLVNNIQASKANQVFSPITPIDIHDIPNNQKLLRAV